MSNIWRGRKVELRGPRLEDAETLALAPIDSEADAFAHQIELPLNRTLEWEQQIIQRWIELNRNTQNADCNLAIVPLTTNKFAGTVGMHNTHARVRVSDLNVWVASNEQNKGYGGEAILILLNYAFNELDYQKIELGVAEQNIHASKLYEKLGFIEEGRLRRRYIYKGEYHAEIKMGILAEEFRAKHSEFISYLYSEH